MNKDTVISTGKLRNILPTLSEGYGNFLRVDATGRLIVKLCDCKECENKKSLKELLDAGYEVVIKK